MRYFLLADSVAQLNRSSYLLPNQISEMGAPICTSRVYQSGSEHDGPQSSAQIKFISAF